MTSVLSLPSSTSSLLGLGKDDFFGRYRTSAASDGSLSRHRRISHPSRVSSPFEQLAVCPLSRPHNVGNLPRSESCLDLLITRDQPLAHSQTSRSPDTHNHPRRTQLKPKERTPNPDQTNQLSRQATLDSKYSQDEGPQSSKENKHGIEASTDDDTRCTVMLEASNDRSSISSVAEQPLAFRKWISKLRKRHQYKISTVIDYPKQQELDGFNPQPTVVSQPHRTSHRKSDSQGSSLMFVHAVKSVTETVVSASIVTLSRQTTKWRHGARRSSVASGPNLLKSAEIQIPFVDEAARQRSHKRRQKLEELIRTEESYVADIKALSNTYSTIICHHPTQVNFVRPAAQRILGEILDLHDEMLGCLYRIVPLAEYDRKVAKATEPLLQLGHTRWHSVDIMPLRPAPANSLSTDDRNGRRSLNLGRTTEEDLSMLQCSPQVIASVAEVFVAQINRFKVYEEYGLNYDLLYRDIEEIQQSIPTWCDFDRAIEALSTHLNPSRSQVTNSKRAMTVKDLLIKPIQRLPRYELLFSDLCILTPVCDGPETYAALNDLRIQLNTTCRRMNEAKSNTNRTKMLEINFLIENRLKFSSQVPRPIFAKLLGHVQLCGCLYVAYRSREHVQGRYVICVLFQSTLLLAQADEDNGKYDTLAGIGLANATIEETDNGKGLQCHTASHAWKIIFEHSTRMYELLFVACSAAEAVAWRVHVAEGIRAQSKAVSSGASNVFELQSPLVADMRSVGKAFGKSGTFVSRMSVHRTATTGRATDLNQVIIKNTRAMKELQDSSSQHSLQIARSQSVAPHGHIQTLTPRRAERHRLETLLADVWTRDLLPYPSMVRRSDPIRISANNVIRKFSMASIASNFSASRRSTSYNSIVSRRREEFSGSKPKRFTNGPVRQRGQEKKPSSLQLVDFHNAPEAFLPADFELQDPKIQRKKSALRTLTMTMERPFSPLLRNENMASGLRRAQSARDRLTSTLSPRTLPRPEHESETPKPERSEKGAPQEQAQAPACHQGPHDIGRSGMEGPKSAKKTKSRNKLLRLFAIDHH